MTAPALWRCWPELIVFAWAIGEATIVPIMPDAILVPLALARPRSWWRLAISAMLGSTLGGIVSYRLARRVPTIASIERLPLVRPAMVATTDQWLATEGPRGVARQPLTGVPFNVFARLAGAHRLPIIPFLTWAVAARGARFLVASGGAALISRRFGPFTLHTQVGLTALWWTVFALGLWRLVHYWTHASPGRAPGMAAAR